MLVALRRLKRSQISGKQLSVTPKSNLVMMVMLVMLVMVMIMMMMVMMIVILVLMR